MNPEVRPEGRLRGSGQPPQGAQVPLWLKLAYTAFMAVLVPVYWVNCGPTNFVHFCDAALFLTSPAPIP